MSKDEKGSMMRVTASLLKDLKLLKDVKSVKGRLGTFSNLVHSLVKDELRKTHAFTKDGYVKVGSVVRGPDEKPTVIKTIREDMVIFSDNTYVINGGGACYNLELLADCIEDFDGGLIYG